MRYRKLSEYLKEKYGERVQRIVIFGGFSCPNRDGTKGKGGCIYCDATGSGFTTLMKLPIREQVVRLKEKYEKRGIKKFIAYFQAFSNTYAPVEELRKKYEEALIDESIVQLSVSTRPDLVSESVLDLLEEFKERVDVSIELGLQTANYKTLEKINRGHTLAEFIDAAVRVKRRRIELIVHVILNLPWDDMIDVIETAKILSALDVDGVKIHSLYVVEGTKLAEMYKRGEIKICSLEEYVNRVIVFLEHLSPNVVIHRLVADPPREGTIFGNWGKSKIEIINTIEREMERRNSYQGKKFVYLNR
ncbi:TIGR01212 family radical SAM protein [Thermotoga sp. KOL6]|uniref:TIGR01212 family radical SAM protein n=1 Tax=Thermotoga sp. KOL6 TaxID=126741 RepID=UPI000C78A511|nr:TIGR01212 family radical SAM protein [Thermotoga sp. KOL6]PLV59234.1 radical SAM protein [Thermotoga sp. KOL6]